MTVIIMMIMMIMTDDDNGDNSVVRDVGDDANDEDYDDGEVKVSRPYRARGNSAGCGSEGCSGVRGKEVEVVSLHKKNKLSRPSRRHNGSLLACKPGCPPQGQRIPSAPLQAVKLVRSRLRLLGNGSCTTGPQCPLQSRDRKRHLLIHVSSPGNCSVQAIASRLI